MEEKDVQRLLDMLYSMIDEAKSAAFSSDKCVISRDEALDLLDDIRAKLPLEIKKAQELVMLATGQPASPTGLPGRLTTGMDSPVMEA